MSFHHRLHASPGTKSSSSESTSTSSTSAHGHLRTRNKRRARTRLYTSQMSRHDDTLFYNHDGPILRDDNGRITSTSGRLSRNPSDDPDVVARHGDVRDNVWVSLDNISWCHRPESLDWELTFQVSSIRGNALERIIETMPDLQKLDLALLLFPETAEELSELQRCKSVYDMYTDMPDTTAELAALLLGLKRLNLAAARVTVLFWEGGRELHTEQRFVRLQRKMRRWGWNLAGHLLRHEDRREGESRAEFNWRMLRGYKAIEWAKREAS